MLRHIVLLRWKPDADEAAREAVREAIAAMPGRTSEIRTLRWGDNVGNRPNAYDFAVVMDFDDRAAFDRYLAGDAHREYVVGPARAAVASIAAIQHA
jgi:hypothetical protein